MEIESYDEIIQLGKNANKIKSLWGASCLGSQSHSCSLSYGKHLHKRLMKPSRSLAGAQKGQIKINESI
jgi:hypothetical protein